MVNTTDLVHKHMVKEIRSVCFLVISLYCCLLWSHDGDDDDDDDEYTNLCNLCCTCSIHIFLTCHLPSASFSFLHYTLIVIIPCLHSFYSMLALIRKIVGMARVSTIIKMVTNTMENGVVDGVMVKGNSPMLMEVNTMENL